MAKETKTEADLRKTSAEASLVERQIEERGSSFFKKPAFFGSLVPAAALVFGILQYALAWDTLDAEGLAQEARRDRLEAGNMLLEHKQGLLEEMQAGLEESIAILIAEELELSTTAKELRAEIDALVAKVQKTETTVGEFQGLTPGQRGKMGKAMRDLRGEVEAFSNSNAAKAITTFFHTYESNSWSKASVSISSTRLNISLASPPSR